MEPIKLTESVEMRDARMWQKFMAAQHGFERHCVLIEWQDNNKNPKMTAWMEGPKGFTERVDSGKNVGTYKQMIAQIADQMGL